MGVRPHRRAGGNHHVTFHHVVTAQADGGAVSKQVWKTRSDGGLNVIISVRPRDDGKPSRRSRISRAVKTHDGTIDGSYRVIIIGIIKLKAFAADVPLKAVSHDLSRSGAGNIFAFDNLSAATHRGGSCVAIGGRHLSTLSHSGIGN